MVQVDVPVALGVGSFIADAARKQLQRGGPVYYYDALAKNNLCQIFLFSWILVYFILNYFGWETSYRWWTKDSVQAYPFFVPVFLLVFFATGNLGFLVGNWLVKSGRPEANRAIYGGVLVFAAVWVLSQTGRVLRVGTYSQWSQGQAAWIYEDHMFLFMLVFTLLLWGIGLFLFYRHLQKQGQGFE